MRKIVLSSAVSVTLVAATLAATQTASSADPTATTPSTPSSTAGTTGTGAAVRTDGEYVVLYDEGTTEARAGAAHATPGGTHLTSNAPGGVPRLPAG
ncbi:hypothetical protein [Kineococcus sp. SYSU DK005]|uniref:hypothetical protein n=1 Tax=Kineococcus sp. SYSU DK005 TaxID=3383126 RepID=UPI003D7D31FD